MKEFLYQFYNEGFATTFYQKPIKYLNKKVSNKRLLKILSITMQVIYTIAMIIVAIYVFLLKYPFY